jgi:hypothetical protein
MGINKKTLSISGIFIITSIFLALAFSPSFFVPPTSISSPIEYEGAVSIYTTGDFEGRQTEPHAGILETLQILDHNLLYGTGQNMTRDCLTSGGCGAITNITLCNATAGCGEPVAGAGETYTEFGACGLEPVVGTVTDYGVEGNYTVSTTFTATCDTLTTNLTRLTNASGSNFAGNSFNLASLDSTDTLVINWSIGIS